MAGGGALDEMSLLTGALDLDSLPGLPKTEVKVYICSTAADMQVEQTAFMKTVYPNLREFCRRRHGMDFHAVDGRWSASSSSGKDGDWMMYLSILEDCQRMSTGPNFVALIGQRLGDCLLPSIIPAADYELIRQALTQTRGRLSKEAPILDQWYLRDDNMTNPAYLLQRQNQNSRASTPMSRFLQEPTWERTQCLLRQLLQKGIELCLQNGTIANPDTLTFLITDFERELQLGLQSTPNQSTKGLAFFRTIVDLKNYVTLPVSQKFAEISCAEGPEGKPRLDEECQRRLTAVKDTVSRRLPAKQSVSNSILWKYEDGINTYLHKDYLANVCQAFETKMEEILSEIPESNRSMSQEDSVLDEIQQHWMIARDLSRCYVQREQVLDLLRSYVVSNENKPLVVFGEAGTGKSTVLAKAAAEASGWIDGCQTISVVRFLGSTTHSLDIHHTLLSISRQILTATGSPPEATPVGYVDLVNHFFHVLDSFPDDKCLVVFIDGIELLGTHCGAHLLEWLPRHMKENVKIVLSVTTGPILETLRNDVIRRSNNFVEVPLLLPEECRALLRALLAEKSRKLTDEQESAVFENSFAYCATPLVVKMTADVVRRWSSTTEPELGALPGDVNAGIEGVFDDLERRFGSGFVTRVLALLTASLKGLSDCEMEDLLSMDDVALKEVSESFGSRDLVRIPPIAWQRIKYELQDLLRSVFCEGVTLVYWRHRAFADAARARYLKEEKRRQDAHSLIATYWMGPRGNQDIKPSDDNRLVPTQPLIFRDPDSDNPHPLYNLRKFDQLPVHLSLSGRHDDLNNSVLFRFEWLYHKTRAFSLESVLCDYSLGKGVEVQLVESALRDAAYFINENPENLAAEVSGRLLGYYNNHSNIRELIDECDRLGVDYCALVPNFPYRQMPGGALRHVVHCVDTPKECVVLGEEDEVLLAKDPASSFIQVVDLVEGERRGAIPASVGSMYVSRSGRHAAVVDYAREKSVKLHSLETGKFLGHLIPVNHISLSTKDTQDLTHVCLTDTHLCLVISAESNWLCIADVTRCVMASVLNVPKRVSVCQITPDSRHVFVNAGTTLLSYDLETMEMANNSIFEEVPNQLYFTQDSRIGFVVGEQADRLMKITLNEGKIEFQVKLDIKASMESDSIQDLQLSKSQELLLIRGQSNLIVYHLADDRPLCHIERPSEVPTEFRLPKSSYTELKFSQAKFAGEDKYLAATIFRDVLIWQLGSGSSCRLVSTLRTPIGLIDNLYTDHIQGQLITVSRGSKEIQIWSIQDALGHVAVLDRMTSPISEIVITADDSKAFVTCDGSDEIGIVDMRTGNVIDLLTHESPVVSLSISASGEFAIVAVDQTKPGQYNKIWNTVGRRVLGEYGNTSAVTIYSEDSLSFLSFLQVARSIKDPFHLSIFKQTDGGAFEELKTDIEVSFVLQKPFLTAEDHYMVLLSAEDFDHSKTHYIDPCVCSVSLRTPIMTMTTFTPSGLRDRVPNLRRILHIRPCPSNPYTIILLYTNEPDPVNGRRAYEHNHGFLILDLCSAVICQLIDDFYPPSTPLADVLFTRDTRLSVDHRSNVYDMANGHCLERLHPGKTRPRRLAMRDAVVLYADEQYLSVVRIADRKCLGRLSVHADIRAIEVCHDDRTIVVGCADGSIVSHVIVDVDVDDRSEVISKLSTRKSRFFGGGAGALRFWDKVNTAPDYARAPSAIVEGGLTERQRLQTLRPIAKVRSNRPPSSSQLYDHSYGSQTCITM